ncbi:MAG: MotA/TolQ/ExbB proton channel family protein [Clostridia bacterium]|nr:MotA/TolQ/ExbB proton channel family protein [Deltaproteobacteria bacterium]
MTGSVADLIEQGGTTFILIVLMSVLALTVGIERWAAMFVARKRMIDSTERILEHLRTHNRTMALAVNSTLARHPSTKLFEVLLADRLVPHTEVKRMQARIIRGTKTRLWILGTVGATAPFVGLFGTVVGIMRSFRSIGEAGGGGFSVVSGGISEALVTTAAGIAVGVLAMVLFNYLGVQAGAYAAELRENVEEITESYAAMPVSGLTAPQQAQA